MKHTIQEDFEHFLAYSGMSNEPKSIKLKLAMAFYAGTDEDRSDEYDEFINAYEA